jgi:ketosteroid isomerase-like protein
MSEEERRELATEFIEALRARDGQRFRAIMTEDIVWSLPGSSIVSGLAQGVDGILSRANKLVSYGVKLEILHVVFGYEGVALLLHNTAAREGRVLDEYLTTVCTLRDQKIARLDTYISDIPMLNSFFV